MAPAKAVALVLMSLSFVSVSTASASPDPCLLVTNSSEVEKNSTELLRPAVCSKQDTILDIDSHIMDTSEDSVFLEGE